MKKILFGVGVLFILLSVNSQITTADAFEAYPVIKIIDATYAELDNDTLANDVMVDLSIKTSARNESFWLYLEIILPSGITHGEFFFVEVDAKNFNIRIEGHNMAIEGGWYEARAYLAIPIPVTPNPNAACWRLELHHSLIFDPDGKGGGDPLYWAMMLL